MRAGERPRPSLWYGAGRVRDELRGCLVLAIALLGSAGCRRALGDPETDPSQPATADERALSREELLGKRLFEDVALSEPPGVSCASCHDERRAFSGANGSTIPAVARGAAPGAFGTRSSPSLLYASLVPPFAFALVQKENAASKELEVPRGGLFWDGRADTLAEQAKDPILGAREMNAGSAAALVEKVKRAPYAALARGVLGSRFDDADAAFDALAGAIGAYEATPRFRPFRSKFDDYLRGQTALTDAEQRGFSLFKDPNKGNCIACHEGKTESRLPEDWLFTDFTYSALGAPRNPALPDNRDPSHFDRGLCDSAKLARLLPRGRTTDVYCGSFRVPSLRNVAVTAPYMHNGVFTDLHEVVSFYATRSTTPQLWYPTDTHYWIQQYDDLPVRLRVMVSEDEVPYDRTRGEAPRLDGQDVDDLVAFLETLTDR